MNIELSQLEKLKTDNEACNEEIVESFTTIKSTLDDICNNLKSQTLTAATQNLVDAIIDVTNKINIGLPKITDFLNQQIIAYDTTNVIINADLDSLNATISTNLGK